MRAALLARLILLEFFTLTLLGEVYKLWSSIISPACSLSYEMVRNVRSIYHGTGNIQVYEVGLFVTTPSDCCPESEGR
jgi:hypothetical protein